MESPIQKELRKRPSVHQLCYGPFLQEPIRLATDVLAVPLQPLGFNGEALYVAQYVHECQGGQVDKSGLDQLCKQGKDALPVVALCVTDLVEARAELLEDLVKARLDRARLILSWATGDTVEPFAMATATLSAFHFRVLPPFSRRRQRLGFGNTGSDFQNGVDRIAKAAMDDVHFAFALALLHDANHEPNPMFRIGRLFNVLESLAANLKKGRGSREAVRYMLSAKNTLDFMSTITVKGVQVRYDPIEIGGRVRDKLFHGAPFRAKDLNAQARPVFQVLSEDPKPIADTLLAYCELEVARWANGVSLGLPKK